MNSKTNDFRSETRSDRLHYLSVSLSRGIPSVIELRYAKNHFHSLLSGEVEQIHRCFVLLLFAHSFVFQLNQFKYEEQFFLSLCFSFSRISSTTTTTAAAATTTTRRRAYFVDETMVF